MGGRTGVVEGEVREGRGKIAGALRWPQTGRREDSEPMWIRVRYRTHGQRDWNPSGWRDFEYKEPDTMTGCRPFSQQGWRTI